MKTLAIVVFIAGAAAVAGFLAQRKTVADGRVIEADLLTGHRSQGVTGMACDREIPIGISGAAFRCVATFENGVTQTLDYTMDREGNLSGTVVAEPSSGDPSRIPSSDEPARIPPSGDPWAN